MKVSAWYSRGVYPLDNLEREDLFSLRFQDEEGETASRVLLTGISGVGKSTLLRNIGNAWAGLASLLIGQAPKVPAGNVAMLMEGLLEDPVLLCYAPEEDFWQALSALHPDTPVLGVRAGAVFAPKALRQALYQAMADAKKRPNMLLLMEDYRTQELADLTGYTVSLEEVESYIRAAGGLTQALLQLHRENPECLTGLREHLNALLSGKQMEDAQAQYRVLTRGGATHAPEALSSGERRMLLLLFAGWAVLHPGGVLLVDEPESHIHPSQVPGLLSTLEELATAHDGQLILSSHMPQVWRRYENLGLVVTLEGRA